MKIHFGFFRIEAPFFPIILLLCLLSILISLGFWQLSRAEEKSSMLAQQTQRGQDKIIQLNANTVHNADLLRFRKVNLSGKYDQDHQFLIDNQVVDGRVGYFVMTPFVLAHTNKAVLVNRGWVPLNKIRSILPEINFTPSATEVTGRINHFPSVGMILSGAEIPTAGWPSVVQVVDSTVLEKKLNYPLFDFQVQLDKDQADGYLRQWKTSIRITPEKHVAYAVQWFGLALTLSILFLWFYVQQENNE